MTEQAKAMAEVIRMHAFSSGETYEGDYWQTCSCQADPLVNLEGYYVDHLAAALSAAGFGLVADAGAKALEDAADELNLPGTSATGYYSSGDHAGYAEAEGHAEDYLRSRAATIRTPHAHD